MSDYNDCIQPSAYRYLYRTARKSHECCECHREIKSGEKYEYISGIWDGLPTSYKTCLECADIRDKYLDNEDNETVALGKLACEISNDLCAGYGIKEYAEDNGIELDKLKMLIKE